MEKKLLEFNEEFTRLAALNRIICIFMFASWLRPNELASKYFDELPISLRDDLKKLRSSDTMVLRPDWIFPHDS